MADILINGNRLELYRDSAVDIELYSAWFQEELKDDLVLPFKIPYQTSFVNRQLLQHIDLPQAIYDSSRITVLVSVKGTYRMGHMILRRFEVDLTINIQILNGQMEGLNTNLRDLNLPNSQTLANLYSSGVSTWPEAKCFFPMVLNQYFYDDKQEEASSKKNVTYKGVLNQHDTATGSYVANLVDNGTTINQNTLVPMVALLEVIKVGLAQDGYRLIGDLYESNDWRQAFLYNNKALDVSIDNNASLSISEYAFNLASSQIFKVIYSTGQGTGVNVVNNQYEVHKAGNFTLSFRADIKPGGHTGTFTAVLVYDGVDVEGATYLNQGGTIRFDRVFNFATADIGKAIYVELRNDTSLSVPIALQNVKLQVTLDEDNLIEFYNPENLAEFLPDISFGELISTLQRDLFKGLQVDIDNKTVNLVPLPLALQLPAGNHFNEQLSQPMAIDFNKPQSLLLHHNAPGDFEKEAGRQEYNKYMLASPSGQISILTEKPNGFDGINHVLKLHPLAVLSRTINPYPGLPYGTVQERGISDVIDAGGDSVSIIRLGFLRWVNGYPVASPYHGNVDLRLSFDPGSIANDAVVWHTAMQADTRLYKARLWLSRSQANGLNQEEPIVIRGVKYLIVQMRYSSNHEDYMEVRLSLRKI